MIGPDGLALVPVTFRAGWLSQRDPDQYAIVYSSRNAAVPPDEARRD